MVHQFKDFVGTQDSTVLTCELKSTLAPTTSTVFLQIYNQNSTTWETVDSDNTTGANTDFTLTGAIPDLTDYTNVNLVSCRVYQEAT